MLNSCSKPDVDDSRRTPLVLSGAWVNRLRHQISIAPKEQVSVREGSVCMSASARHLVAVDRGEVQLIQFSARTFGALT